MIQSFLWHTLMRFSRYVELWMYYVMCFFLLQQLHRVVTVLIISGSVAFRSTELLQGRNLQVKEGVPLQTRFPRQRDRHTQRQIDLCSEIIVEH